MNYIKHGLIPAEKARFIHNSTTVDVYDPETNTYSTRDGEYYTIDFYRKRADIIIENRFVKFSTCRIRHGRVVDAAVLLETERGELVILKHDNVRLNNIFEMISTYSVGDIVAFDIDDFICNLNQPHIFVSNVGEDLNQTGGVADYNDNHISLRRTKSPKWMVNYVEKPEIEFDRLMKKRDTQFRLDVSQAKNFYKRGDYYSGYNSPFILKGTENMVNEYFDYMVNNGYLEIKQ